MQLTVSPPTIEHDNVATAAADNPFAGDCRIHVNPHSEPVICVRWSVSNLPWEGLAFLHGVFERGNPAWLGTARLEVVARQGERVYRSTSLIEDGEQTRWGVGVINDGSPFTLEFTVNVRTPEAYVNGLFSISAIALDRPVYESTPALFDLSGEANRSAKTLTSANQGGLMNRLVPMLSTLLVAEQSGRRAQVLWGPNEHCAASFEHLFDLGENDFAPGDIGALAADYRVQAAYEPQSPPLFLDASETNIIVHSTSLLVTEPDLGFGHAQLRPIFKRLSLATPIRTMLAKFDGIDFNRMIGLHIRRPYPGSAFAAQENAKFRLGIDVFTDLVRDLRLAAPWMQRVLVCTNGPQAETEMRDAFGDLIFTFKKSTIDNTREPLAVQEAIVDLTLMSRCPLLFSQETTSFGHFAHVVGGGTMVAVTNATSADTYNFWLFREGCHVETDSCGRGDTARLAQLVEAWTTL